MGEIVLKARISNDNYIWRAEDGACEKCQALNGLTFENIDKIPDKPHPNCRCWVEMLGENGRNGKGGIGYSDLNDPPEDDELCDCWKFYDEIEEVVGDARSLKDEVDIEIDDMVKILQKNYIGPFGINIEDCYNALKKIHTAISIFIKNYNDMKIANTKKADKYFHSKANCEAAQLGNVGEITAQAISDLREFTDSFKNVCAKKMAIKDSLKDIKEDQEANKYGRRQGSANLYHSCRDLVEIYRPNGLPTKY